MATGDDRCEQAIEQAIRSAQQQTASSSGEKEKITPDQTVNVDELLALLDPSKNKAHAHIVFIKAEYTPVVPLVSDFVCETVDKAGYFAIAKALLDVKTDENGCALALDMVEMLERELELDEACAVAVALAVADSKSIGKLTRGFAAKKLHRFGQLVSDSRDKVVASAAEAREKIDHKFAEATVKVVTCAGEARNRLQALVNDDTRVGKHAQHQARAHEKACLLPRMPHSHKGPQACSHSKSIFIRGLGQVLGSRRVKKIAEIASDPEKSLGSRVYHIHHTHAHTHTHTRAHTRSLSLSHTHTHRHTHTHTHTHAHTHTHTHTHIHVPETSAPVRALGVRIRVPGGRNSSVGGQE